MQRSTFTLLIETYTSVFLNYYFIFILPPFNILYATFDIVFLKLRRRRRKKQYIKIFQCATFLLLTYVSDDIMRKEYFLLLFYSIISFRQLIGNEFYYFTVDYFQKQMEHPLLKIFNISF